MAYRCSGGIFFGGGGVLALTVFFFAGTRVLFCTHKQHSEILYFIGDTINIMQFK